MAERTSLTQVNNLRVESTPGTDPGTGTKRLNSLSIETAIATDTRRFRPTGRKVATLLPQGKEWTTFRMPSSPLTYPEIVYPLSGILCAVTPAQIGATAGYRWTFTPSSTLPQDPTSGEVGAVKTFTIEHGSSTRAHKLVYALFSDFEMAFSRDEVTISGGGFGQAITDGITITASPTELAQVPVLGKQVSVYMDAASANLGTTKLTRVMSGVLRLANRFSPLWVVNAANASFVTGIEVEPTAELELTVEADAAGMALLTSLRADTVQFIRINATGANIGSAADYTVQFDVAVKVKSVSPWTDADGVFAITWTFEIVYDATWTKWLEAQVVSTVVSL